MQEAVRIENAREVKRALGKLAPEAKKALDKANRAVATPLANFAKGFYVDSPMSNWGKWTDARGRDLSYNAAEVRKGVKIRAGSKSKKSPWSALTQLQNTTPAGAIYEMAGRASNDSQFVQNMQNVKTVAIRGLSRGIWSAIKGYPISKYQTAVIENYAEAEKELQKILDGLKNG